MANEAYLGDGAYIKSNELDDVVIYTHNGIKITNEVYLGTYEIEHLLQWLRETGRIK